MVHVNLLAVLVATVVVFLLGWLWYSPLLFFKPWMRLRGLDPAAAMQGQKMPVGKLAVELVRCFVLSYLMARFLALLGVAGVMGGVHFGVLAWIAFPVILLTGSVLWDAVKWQVAAIHAGDWLVKMLVIPIIVVTMH
ncbi:MAG TPA: DUF1761 domain-containing protein [Gemmatimonadales bacterium]|nr:DUF1761 domain-containing protein [Gemmatimonadales bacterium]